MCTTIKIKGGISKVASCEQQLLRRKKCSDGNTKTKDKLLRNSRFSAKMKGHTVPWAFLPTGMQALLAVILVVMVVRRTYHDVNLIKRVWPLTAGVAFVLLAPLAVSWAGFGPSGPVAKSLAAELQSVAVSIPWAQSIVSALQSIGTKGIGLKTTAVVFGAGGSLGYMAVQALLRYAILPIPLLQPLEQQPQQHLEADVDQQQQQQHPHDD